MRRQTARSIVWNWTDHLEKDWDIKDDPEYKNVLRLQFSWAVKRILHDLGPQTCYELQERIVGDTDGGLLSQVIDSLVSRGIISDAPHHTRDKYSLLNLPCGCDPKYYTAGNCDYCRSVKGKAFDPLAWDGTSDAV